MNPKPPKPTAAAQPKGIMCPACGCRHFEVLYTRAAPKGAIRRRRACRHCGRRITTLEHPAA